MEAGSRETKASVAPAGKETAADIWADSGGDIRKMLNDSNCSTEGWIDRWQRMDLDGQKALWRAADSQLYRIICMTFSPKQKVHIEEASFQGKKAGREAFVRLVREAMGDNEAEIKQRAIDQFKRWKFDGKIAKANGRPRTLHQAVSHLRHVANLCTDLAGVKITDEELMLKLRSQLPERLRGAITWIRMNEDEDAPTMLFNDLVKKIDRWATVHREEVDEAVAIKTAALQRHKRGKSDQPRNKPTPPWFKKQGGATGKQAKGGPKSGPSANTNEPTCWNCGRKGHVKADCPFPVKCAKCGKTGHTAKECNSNVELRHCNICGKQ